MAGDGPHLPLEAGRLVGVAVVDQHVGRRADQRRAETGRKVQPGIGQFGGVAGADHQRAVGPSLFQGRIAADVVAMAVRVQNGRRRSPAAPDGG